MAEECSMKAYFMKDSDLWGTPQYLFDELDKEFDFTLDPCASDKRTLKEGIKQYTVEDNGLMYTWTDERVFCNPPYSNIKNWVHKCLFESRRAGLVVLLIPSRTDTAYFHDYIYHKADIRFIRGRLKFVNIEGTEKKNELTHGAPFPSMIVIYKRIPNETH